MKKNRKSNLEKVVNIVANLIGLRIRSKIDPKVWHNGFIFECDLKFYKEAYKVLVNLGFVDRKPGFDLGFIAEIDYHIDLYKSGKYDDDVEYPEFYFVNDKLKVDLRIDTRVEKNGVMIFEFTAQK